jgi:hypothetical protein
MSADRLKDAWKAAQGVDPMIRYRCIYRAKVLGQSGDLQAVDVRPFDASLPDMADIPLRHGVPGIKAQVSPGCSVQIGWDDGRPDRPFAALWSADASALRLVLDCPSLELGAEQPTDFAVKGTSQLQQLVTALTACAAGFTLLGQTATAGTITTAVAQLPLTLSTRVRIGG